MSNPAAVERVLRLTTSVRIPPLPWRALAVVAVVAMVLGGGFLWFRDSSFATVKRVEVIGLSSSEAPAVRRALDAAARNMTTLHLDRTALEDAVAAYPSVAGLRVQTDFPHGVSIEVTEREPIAEVDLAGDVVPVGAGGRLMRGVEPTRRLPVLHATRLAPGGRLTDPQALAAVNVLAAAPEVLRRKVSRIWSGPKGLSIDLRAGPQLFFGSADRPVAKWMATARVLAEPSAAGAVYLDVRVPERVAAGGLGTRPVEAADPLAPTPQGQIVDPQAEPETTATLNP
ncbi:MAG: cell division protein FtsQ [Solirubrobacteraceae bacterium]|nr:cell division protein FtsQ [Solirubrobacteraceae bacterium]